MDKETLDRLEKAFRYGMSPVEACAYAGIPVSLFERFIEGNKHYIEIIGRWRMTPMLIARQTMVQKAAKNPHFALKFAAAKGGLHVWMDKQTLNQPLQSTPTATLAKPCTDF